MDDGRVHENQLTDELKYDDNFQNSPLLSGKIQIPALLKLEHLSQLYPVCLPVFLVALLCIDEYFILHALTQTQVA